MSPSHSLQAHFTTEYPYKRSTGPLLQQWFEGLRDHQLRGVRSETAGVIVPPQEYDPQTAATLADVVDVGPGGEVVSWTWVTEPAPGQPLTHPFAFALIRPDGADSPMLHAVDAGSPEAMATGMRVTARWTAEPVGDGSDLVCFEPEAT